MKKVLFLCTHNSARSQMAEALLNYYFPFDFQAYSAGTAPGKMNIFVIKALKESGIDISQNVPKHIDEFKDTNFDIVITVCDNAKDTCPFFPGKLVLHHPFQDPSTFEGTPDDVLKQVRKLRDEMVVWIRETFPRYVE